MNMAMESDIKNDMENNMRIVGFDHLVLTTVNLAACLEFYVEALGMEHREAAGRHSLHFGKQKINIHTRPGEFLPAAARPGAGSLDICLVVEGAGIEAVAAKLRERGLAIEAGPVARRGARGDMQSLYLRDPDGNLVELAVYDNR